MAGVGLCHSDFMFLDTPPGIIPWALPFTLGHESAGWVEQLGDGVDDLELGQPVAVAGIHSCGRCEFCLRGHDNYCPRGASGRGYGEDGGLAHYLVVPRRELVPLRTLDPRRVGPLTDAGATSYHAVKRALPKLVPGSTAVVIGAGGLGSYAVQYLRRLTGAQVIAVDLVQQRLDLARELGAHDALLSDDDDRAAGPRAHRRHRRHRGVRLRRRRRDHGAWRWRARPTSAPSAIVGAGGGTAKVSWGVLPLECDLCIPMAASIADLHEVIALGRGGRAARSRWSCSRSSDAPDRVRAVPQRRPQEPGGRHPQRLSKPLVRSAPVARLDDLQRVEKAIVRIARIGAGREAARNRAERSGRAPLASGDQHHLGAARVGPGAPLAPLRPHRPRSAARQPRDRAPVRGRLREAGVRSHRRARHHRRPHAPRAGERTLAYRQATDEIVVEAFAGWKAGELRTLADYLERVVTDVSRRPRCRRPAAGVARLCTVDRRSRRFLAMVK